ncbi:hypothetical protein Tco_1462334 [Tanacetum coccineum]
MGKSESKSDATRRSLWLSEDALRNARLLQDKLKAEELAKDKIEAEKVPHFEDHVPPHNIRPNVFVTIQLCADVLTIVSLSAFIFCQLAATLSEISRRSSLESYDHWHGLRFLRLRGQCAWRKSGD